MLEDLERTFQSIQISQSPLDVVGLSQHQKLIHDISAFIDYALYVGGRPEDLHTFVAVHQNAPLSDGHYAMFSDLCQGLVMDCTKPIGEREGFGVALTKEKVKQMLEPKSTVAFTSHSGFNIAGLGILYTTTEMLGAEEQRLVREYCEKAGVNGSSVGYMYLVGTAPEQRRLFSEHGENVYFQILESAANFCALHGITHLLGEVWEDNAALAKHLKKGWEITGIDRRQIRGEEELNRIQVVYG